MSDPIDLSVIIVTWNSESWIQRCLASIYAETSDISFEVIVVDNASTDRSVQFIMNRFSRVSVIQNRMNVGFAAAVDQGIASARGRYLCWLNPDTEIKDRALEQLVAAMDRDETIGILAPQLLNEDGSIQASVRRFPRFADQALILLKLHALWPDAKSLSRYLARDMNYRVAQDVEQVMGACMVVRRELLQQIGTLDTRFFLWFEEVDFCYRTKHSTSYRIVYEPTIHVLHFGGDSFDKVAPGKKQRWYRRSVRQYMLKRRLWVSFAMLWLLTPLSFVMGAIVSIVQKTKRGQRLSDAHKQKRKQL